MDREKAILILTRCEAESYCSHYKQHHCCIGCGQREALDLAIEALEREIEYGQMVVDLTKGEKVDDWVYDEDETSTTTDCISREWLKGQIEEVEYENAWHMKETGKFVSWENIENAPSVTLTERPKWEWIKSNEYKYECPFCHVDFGNFGLKMNYCPNCGAKMKGGTE